MPAVGTELAGRLMAGLHEMKLELAVSALVPVANTELLLIRALLKLALLVSERAVQSTHAAALLVVGAHLREVQAKRIVRHCKKLNPQSVN